MLKFIVYAPVLFLQSLWVLVKTRRLPEASGERRGKTTLAKEKLRLLIIGDSAAAGVGVSRQTEALSGNMVKLLENSYAIQWQVVAWTGCKTRAMIDKLEEEPMSVADVIVISLGVNDVTSFISTEKWAAQFMRLLSLITRKLSPRLILVTATPPFQHFPALPGPLKVFLGLRAEAFNQRLAGLLENQHNCLLLQLPVEAAHFAADGFHPGETGYRLWADEAARAIEARLTVKR
jgi:lysophospholipase L1-like esterase